MIQKTKIIEIYIRTFSQATGTNLAMQKFEKYKVPAVAIHPIIPRADYIMTPNRTYFSRDVIAIKEIVAPRGLQSA